ncbi:MAG TPA: dCTP deaminase [Candidatus Bathyarchaeia archaeon]|nr:dCTP deaminase [Candidatus Bathyarchaeia archaeon]
MILSHDHLKRAWKRRQIRFSPDIDEGQIAESSIDLRLGYVFTKLRPQPKPVRPAAEGFDPHRVTESQNYEYLSRPVFKLRPREFMLGFTLEEVSVPGWLAANVQGKSSLARAGLAVHITAPHINPGFVARITLEMYNHGPWNLELIPGKDLVCQVIFYKLTSPVSKKVINAFGTYIKQSTPYPA